MLLSGIHVDAWPQDIRWIPAQLPAGMTEWADRGNDEMR